MGCVKHFVANEQENDRFTVSVQVPERTLWELYYPPFQAAIEVSNSQPSVLEDDHRGRHRGRRSIDRRPG